MVGDDPGSKVNARRFAGIGDGDGLTPQGTAAAGSRAKPEALKAAATQRRPGSLAWLLGNDLALTRRDVLMANAALFGAIAAAGAGHAQPIQTFAQWLASTNAGSGPTRYWPMGDAPGITMSAAIGGIGGTWINTTDLEFGITDQDSLNWMGFGGGAAPGHGTLATPLQSAAFTALMVIQLDLVKPQHVLLTTAGGSVPGEFSMEVVQDGAGGQKPRVWSVNDSGEAVIFEGTSPGTVPVGTSCALFYVRRSNGTQEVWVVADGAASQIGLTLDSGTPPSSWSAQPAATWYVGTWPSFIPPLDGVARSLALWNVALPAGDIVALASINPPIRNVVWARDVDAGEVGVSSSRDHVSLTDAVHPEVGFTPAITQQGALGSWGTDGQALTYDAGSTPGTDTAGRYRITKGGIASPVAALTIEVGPSPTQEDLPFFGQYYGSAGWGAGAANLRLRDMTDQGESFFFYAERTGTVEALHAHARIGEGYSDGDNGSYTVQIRPADPVTKRPIPGSSPVCEVTGWEPGTLSTGPHFPVIEFTTMGQLVAKQPYCVVFRREDTGGYVSQNVNAVVWHDDSLPIQNYTEPGRGGGVGDILVASGGIEPHEVGTSAAIVAGWTPFVDADDQTLYYPWPIGTEDGALRGRRLGPAFLELVYADGVVTNWGSWGNETGLAGSGQGSWRVPISGNKQWRIRFQVSRDTRQVSGVFIRSSRNGSGAGDVRVRLESGPTTDDHFPNENGTLIEEVPVDPNLFLNTGTFETNVQVFSGSPSGLLELVHWVWVPFTSVRTLTLGDQYSLRILCTGTSELILWSSGRNDQQASFSPDGRNLTWAQFMAQRRLSWSAWEDCRDGVEWSQNGGSTWNATSARNPPVLFKCV